MLAVLAASATMSLASCTDDPARDAAASPTPTPAGCSAAGREAPPEPSGLPPEVATMRERIIEAALRCDFESLDELAVAGAPTFNYSFGEPNERPDAKPGPYWEAQERRGEPVLETMVRMLGLPYGVTRADDTIYVWPSAAGEAPSDDDWAALEEEFGAERVEAWRSPEGFLGPRIGITEDGDWLHYVAGD